MNALQSFIAARPFGFVVEADMPDLIKLHRLCQLLVRCGGKRFICAAQDAADMIRAVESAGDYVRDVSITSAEIQNATGWQPERQIVATGKAWSVSRNAARHAARIDCDFNEADCSGAFDGFTVTSDADPGL